MWQIAGQGASGERFMGTDPRPPFSVPNTKTVGAWQSHAVSVDVKTNQPAKLLLNFLSGHSFCVYRSQTKPKLEVCGGGGGGGGGGGEKEEEEEVGKEERKEEIDTHARTHPPPPTHARTHAHTRTHTHTRTHARTHARTHTSPK